jgi:hypothetical protein
MVSVISLIYWDAVLIMGCLVLHWRLVLEGRTAYVHVPY